MLKAHPDHWNAWLRLPGLDFNAQMSQTRLWRITTKGEQRKAQPRIDSTAMCAKFLDMPLAGVLWSQGGAPDAVRGDGETISQALKFFA